MQLKVWLIAQDGGDGSVSVLIYNTKEEGLKRLNRTEEQMSSNETSFYDDGYMEQIVVDIDEKTGLLKTPIYINIE